MQDKGALIATRCVCKPQQELGDESCDKVPLGGCRASTQECAAGLGNLGPLIAR